MRCDVLAIGTELLLGQIVDTNSSWIGEQLAAAGIDTLEHRKVGDNLDRVVRCIRSMLEVSDALIICGGLGPTPDDLTREAIAEVMGVPLERRDELVEWIANLFGGRGRQMPENNLRQADVPVGGDVIPNPIGTAPGLRCEVEGRVIYAVPGVPYEMHRMVSEHVLPDLLERSGERAVIVNRSLKTWGASESGLAEMIAEQVDAQTNPSIAFLARGIEGIVVRLTAKAPTVAAAEALIAPEEARLRATIGDLIFGIDDETMEHAVLSRLEARGWTLGVATGKGRRGLLAVLERHGLAGRFATLQTGDVGPGKPHPAMLERALAETGIDAAQAVMIGDTSFDMLMARSAGVRGFGVSWGYHAPEELEAAGAVALASDFAHLVDLLAGA